MSAGGKGTVPLGDTAGEPLVLGIAGSPRANGNSDRLLEAALDAAGAAGARTRVLAVRDVQMSPCRGCNACSTTGECVQDDGADLYATLDAADAVIVASPVYFAGVPAQLKALIDRLQPYWARRYVLGEPRGPRRPGGVLLVGAGGDPFGSGGAEATLRSALANLEVDVLAVVTVEGPDAPGDVSTDADALDRARALGEAVAGEAVLRTDGRC